MFGEHQEILFLTAEISGALLGFVGIVLVLGNRADGQLEIRDQTGLFHLIFTSVGALFGSLLMLICLSSFGDSRLVWRTGVGLISLYMAYGVVKAMLERKADENRLSAVAMVLLTGGTWAVIGLNVAIVFGFVGEHAPLAYCLSVTYMIGVAVTYFVPLVLLRTR